MPLYKEKSLVKLTTGVNAMLSNNIVFAPGKNSPVLSNICWKHQELNQEGRIWKVLQLGLLWPCPQILRPNWKGLPRANPLAYGALSSVKKEKSFITLILGRPPHRRDGHRRVGGRRGGQPQRQEEGRHRSVRFGQLCCIDIILSFGGKKSASLIAHFAKVTHRYLA